MTVLDELDEVVGAALKGLGKMMAVDTVGGGINKGIDKGAKKVYNKVKKPSTDEAVAMVQPFTLARAMSLDRAAKKVIQNPSPVRWARATIKVRNSAAKTRRKMLVRKYGGGLRGRVRMYRHAAGDVKRAFTDLPGAVKRSEQHMARLSGTRAGQNIVKSANIRVSKLAKRVGRLPEGVEMFDVNELLERAEEFLEAGYEEPKAMQAYTRGMRRFVKTKPGQSFKRGTQKYSKTRVGKAHMKHAVSVGGRVQRHPRKILAGAGAVNLAIGGHIARNARHLPGGVSKAVGYGVAGAAAASGAGLMYAGIRGVPRARERALRARRRSRK